MKLISNDVKNEIIINKSRFIAYLFRLEKISDIDTRLNEVKSLHKDATHYCYAYIIDNIKRFSDDKEPNGTAGMPILNVLESNNLNNTICIVVRYFGGIKLGSGGLVRAYTKAAVEALKLTSIKEYEYGVSINIYFNIKNINIINQVLFNIEIRKKSFNDTVKYELVINENMANSIINSLKPYIIRYEIADKKLLEISLPQ